MRQATRDAIARVDARIRPSGTVRGAATLIASDLVLTALHVVADRESEPVEFYANIRVTFPAFSTSAVVLEGAWDKDLDFAVLKLDRPCPPAVRPLRLAALSDGSKEGFASFGFPEACPDGLAVSGRIEMTSGTYDGTPAIQLYSDQAAAGEGMPICGISGAPCLINDRIVGVIRSSLLRTGEGGTARNVAGTLYACPATTITSGIERAVPGLPSLLSARPQAPPGVEQCTEEWLRRQNGIAIGDLDTRYTPACHVRTESEDLLDAVAIADSFVVRYARALRLASEAARDFSRRARIAVPPAARATVDQLLDEIGSRLPALGTGVIAPPMAVVSEACVAWQRLAQEAWDAIPAAPATGPQRAGTDPRGAGRAQPEDEYARELLRRFLHSVNALAAFAARFACADSRLVLLTGAAGSGKSHLLANLVASAQARRQPALLALGEHFLSADLPWRQLSERIGWESDVGTLLFALDRAAESAGHPALICIDALNESDVRKLWQTQLLAFAKRLDDYPNVRLIVSCRDDFASLTLPAKLAQRREPGWFYVYHSGFGGNVFEAVVSYFADYDVRSQHFPPLFPEFQNPLFLKTFCEAFQGSSVPDGPITLSAVMEARVSRACERLLIDIDCPHHLTRRAIDTVAELMEKSGGRPIPYDDLRTVIDGLFPGKGESGSLYRHLRSNGLLVEVQHAAPGGPSVVTVRFPFERFCEYFVADRMLRPHVDFAALRRAWSCDGTLTHFREPGYGMHAALAILVPERYGREFLSLFPNGENDRGLLTGFLASLAWRTPKSFGDESRRALRAAQRIIKHGFIDSLISVSTIPRHPYNGRFLHDYLKAMPLPKRELEWTLALRGAPAADAVIRWSFQVPHAAVSNEQALLAGYVLAWFCASNHRALRYRATLAAIRLLASRARVAAELVHELHGANDPYVAERIFAIAAGVAIREADAGAVQELAAAVFAAVFAQEKVPPNVLVRDSARCVLEIALRRGVLPPGIVPEQFRPPYRSNWPRIWPESRVTALSAKAAGWRHIFRSVHPESAAGMYGDFGRYTMQADVEHFSRIRLAARLRVPRATPGASARSAVPIWRWHKAQAFSAMAARRWIVQRVAGLGWTPERFEAIDRIFVTGRQSEDVERWREERIGKKYQWIALHELLGYLSDHYRMLPEWGAEETGFAGAWQLYVRDFDPSRPLRDLEEPAREREVGAREAAAPLGRERYPDPFADAALCADPPAWVRALPADFRPLIEGREMPGRNGEWVVLGAHYSWDEPEPLGTLWPRPGTLATWANLRAWLVPREHFADTLSAVRRIQFWGEGAQTVELRSGWLGQYPWGDEHADVRAWCDQPDRWVRDKEMPIVQAIVDCDYGLLPAPRLVEILGARWAGTEVDFVDAEGQVVAFSTVEGRAAFGAPLFVNRAALTSALRAAGLEIIWAIVGDRTCFDHKLGAHITDAEMRFSAVYWLEGDALAGGLTHTDVVPFPK